jgi:hypothetical protein
VAYFWGVSMMGVATLGVCFPASFPVSSRGSPELHVAPLSMSRRWRRFSMSCSMASRRSSVPNKPSCGGVANARNRFYSVVFGDVMRLTCVKYGVFRCRCDARCWFASIGRRASRGYYWLNLNFLVDVETNSVATLGIDYPT